MSVTATGILSVPMTSLAAMIRASASWQAWVAGISPTLFPSQSPDPVFLVQITKTQGDDNGVLAIVGQSTSWERLRIATDQSRSSGGLIFGIIAVVPAAYADIPADAELWFTNAVGAVLSEVFALSEGGGYIAISKMALANLYRCQPELRNSEGDWIKAEFVAEFS